MRISVPLIMLTGVIVCVSVACKETTSETRPLPAFTNAVEEARAGMFEVLRKSKTGVTGIVYPEIGVTVTTAGEPSVVARRSASVDEQSMIQATITGDYERRVTSYGMTGQATSALRGSRTGVVKQALTSAACPKKEGNTWILEGVDVFDGDRHGTGRVTIEGATIHVSFTYDDGSSGERTIEVPENAAFEKADYGQLLDQVVCSGVPPLHPKDFASAEADGSYGVANARLTAEVINQSRQSQKSASSNSFDFLIERANQYKTKKYHSERPGDVPEGEYESFVLRVGTTQYANDQARELSINYSWVGLTLDCPTLPSCPCRHVLDSIDVYVKEYNEFAELVHRRAYYSEHVSKQLDQLPCKDNAEMIKAIKKASEAIKPVSATEGPPSPQKVSYLKELILKCCTTPNDKPEDGGVDGGVDAQPKDGPPIDQQQIDHAVDGPPPDGPLDLASPDAPEHDLGKPDAPPFDLFPLLDLPGPDLMLDAGPQVIPLPIETAGTWTVDTTESDNENCIHKIPNPLISAGYPQTTMANGSAAIESAAEGSTIKCCGCLRVRKSFSLPTAVSTAQATLNLYVTSLYVGDPYNTASLEVRLLSSGADVGTKKYIHDMGRHSNCGKDETMTQGNNTIFLSTIYQGTITGIELVLAHYACIGTNNIIVGKPEIVVTP